MPIRSVLAVDVDDDAFKAFHQTFLKYQTAVARLPGQWKQVTASAQGSKNIFVDMASALMAQAELLRKSDQQMQRNRRTIDETQRSMGRLARSTKEFAGNLMSATSTLLKWTGVGGIVGSLAGILSVQGISRLAQSGSDQFRTSMGYAGPTTPGQVATASAYSAVGNPQQMLGQITQMLQTAEGKQGLTALGIGPSEWGKGAGALLPKVMRELQRVSKNIPEQVLGDVLGGMGLGGFTQQASILKKMTPDQLAQLEAIQISQQRQLNTTTNEMLLNWAKLNSMLEIAGSKIQNAFIEALGPLVPTFNRVVDSFGNAVSDFLKSKQVREWMEALASAIEKVDINDFAQKLKDGALDALEFAKNLKVVAAGLADLVRWIAKTVGNEDLAAKVGLVGGAYAGAKIGGVAGAVLGPAGAATGVIAGGIIGGVAGAYGGARADNAARRKKLWSPDNPNAPIVAEAPIPGAPGAPGTPAGSPGNAHTATGPTAVTGTPNASAAGLPSGVFNLIAQAEGTMGRNGQINYDDMLGHPGGPLGTPPKPISSMTIAELLDWQTQMLRNPNNHFNSSAAGAFQIVRSNIRAALAEGRIQMTDKFDQATQEKLAGHLWKHGGSRHWEGFKAHEGMRAQAEAMAGARSKAATGPAATAAAKGGRDPNDRWSAVRYAPGVKFNSEGMPYSESIETQTAKEKANVEASMAAIRNSQRTGGSWGRAPAAEPEINVTKVPGVRVTVTNDTGGNAITSGAQVAQ